MTTALRLGDRVLFHGREYGFVRALEVQTGAGMGALVEFPESTIPVAELPYSSLTKVGADNVPTRSSAASRDPSR